MKCGFDVFRDAFTKLILHKQTEDHRITVFWFCLVSDCLPWPGLLKLDILEVLFAQVERNVGCVDPRDWHAGHD